MDGQIIYVKPYYFLKKEDSDFFGDMWNPDDKQNKVDTVLAKWGWTVSEQCVLSTVKVRNPIAKKEILYVFLSEEVQAPEGYSFMDVREKEGFGKGALAEVRGFIEWAIKENRSENWIQSLEPLYFGGDSPFYTPHYLQGMKKKALMRKKEAQMSSTALIQSLVFPLLLGVLVDYFFNEGRFGLSVILFLGIMSALMLWKREKLYLHTYSILFGVAAFGLSLSFTIFNNDALRMLNIMILPLVTTAFFLSVTHSAWKNVNLSFFGQLVYQVTFKPATFLIKLTLPFKRVLVKKEMKINPHVFQVVVGVLIGLPILVIILTLLAGSDQIFSTYLDRFLHFKWPVEWDEIYYHMIMISLFSLYFFGYMWSAKYSVVRYKESIETPRFLTSTAMLTILSMILIVYTLFTYIQIRYLFAGGVLPVGFTFAEYARRGFFELVAVTVFNMAILIIAHSVTQYVTPKGQAWVKAMLTVLVGYSFVLLGSGFYRMFLYERAYGYTELRLFVVFFMGFMGLSLVGVVTWIWKEQIPLLKWVLISGISLYLVLNYINMDAVIASKNIHHPNGLESLDQVHISNLSVDALIVISEDLKAHPLYEAIMLDYMDNNRYLLEQYDEWYDYNVMKNRYKHYLMIKGFLAADK